MATATCAPYFSVVSRLFLAGCSPAVPASASPLTLANCNKNFILLTCLNFGKPTIPIEIKYVRLERDE